MICGLMEVMELKLVKMLISTTLEGHYLHATITGKFSLRKAKETFLFLLDTMATHQTHQALIDGLCITGEPSPIERYWYGTFVAEEVLHRIRLGKLEVSPWFAYLLLPPVHDPKRFGENIAWNRGLNVRIFERSDEALNWLLPQGAR